MENPIKQKIAIIGLGNIGQIVAKNLVHGNRAVILADRDLGKAKNISEQLGVLARPMEIGDAFREAEIIILAVWFNAFKELFFQYDAVLQNKIIVDPSNPIAPNDKGGFDKIIGKTESAGLLNAAVLPRGAKLVKALGTLGAASLAQAAWQKPEPAVLFYASDDSDIQSEIESLIHDTGFAPLSVG
ncbi:MAG: NAD(P)-binding domain-containing protein, partial [Saprospiraceae bacterium]|nr:NAD(P)-binding domain-containing protein [Saprospiraceae bacterium]